MSPVYGRSARTAQAAALGGVSALALSVAAGAPAFAQQAAVDEAGLDTITVTGRRYEESAQDVPLGITAMTDDFMAEQGIDQVNDVVLNTPSATFVRFNKLQHEYSIRGINSQSEGSSGDSAVQTVIDNVSISKDFLKNPAMFDIERVEVLRGPQGTSFGRNATAGLVHIITKKPTEEFEAGATAEFGQYGEYGVEAFVNGAITDTLMGRLAGNFDTLDGYTESTRSGMLLAGEENMAIRGSLLFEPNEAFSAYFKAEFNQDDDETPVRRASDCSVPQLEAGTDKVFTTFPPHPPWSITYTDPCDVWQSDIGEREDTGDFFLERDILNLTAELTYDLTDAVTLTSVTGYLDGEANYLINAGGTPENVFWQKNENSADSFTQELRIDNQASGAQLRWLGGVFFLDDTQDRFDENQFFQENLDGTRPLGGPRGPTFDTKVSTNDTQSVGIFGEFTYDFTERWSFNAGGRWSRDEKDYLVAHYGSGWGGPIEGLDGPDTDTDGDGPDIDEDLCAGPPFFCGDLDDDFIADTLVGFVDPVAVSDDWSNFSARASLQFRLDESKMVYGLFSQGYKTGGFQPEPLTPEAALEPYDEETVNSFEIGFKGDFANRYRLNVAGYFMDYEDMQLLAFIPVGAEAFTQRVINGGQAEIFGIDVEYVLQLTDNLSISGGAAFVDAEFVEGTNVDLDGDGLDDLTGTKPDNSPEWTGTAIVSYDIPMANGSFFNVRGDWRGQSDVFDDVGERDGFIASSGGPTLDSRLRPGVNIFGVRASWTNAAGNLTASVYGRNLTEEEELLNVGAPQPNTVRTANQFGPPRRFGGSITIRR